jgi:hypothetical protein
LLEQWQFNQTLKSISKHHKINEKNTGYRQQWFAGTKINRIIFKKFGS